MVTNPDSDPWVFNPKKATTRKGSTLKEIFKESEGSWVQARESQRGEAREPERGKGVPERAPETAKECQNKPERAKKAKKSQGGEARERQRPEKAREERPERAKRGQKVPEAKESQKGG